MKIAYILFDDITTLDFIGAYDPISRLKSQGFISDLSWDLCAMNKSVKDHFGLEFVMDKVRPDLGIYDVIFVPGGFGTRELIKDSEFLQWLKTAENVDAKISICTGSLLLGAAGFLKGKKATTHFNEYHNLEEYGCEIIKTELVDDGDIITAGAVAASLELGLYLCEKWAGKEAKKKISQSMNYKMQR